MNEALHNLFMLISDSQVSISSVMAVWHEWFGLNPDWFLIKQAINKKMLRNMFIDMFF